MAPWDMKGVAREGGRHRQPQAHGHRARLQLRLQQPRGGHALVPRPALASASPSIFDVTHSVQRPGGLGDRSGGDAHFIDTLAPAGVAAGVDGLFMEVHENPARALSDGPNAYRLGPAEGACSKRLLAIHAAHGSPAVTDAFRRCPARRRAARSWRSRRRAILDLVAAHRRGLRPRGGPPLRLHGPRGGHRHGQERHHRARRSRPPSPPPARRPCSCIRPRRIHGDLGRIVKGDAVLAISYSGDTRRS